MKAYTDNNGYLYIDYQGHIHEIYKGEDFISCSYLEDSFISSLKEFKITFKQNNYKENEMNLTNMLIIKSFNKDYSDTFQEIMKMYGYYNHALIKVYNPVNKTINYLIVDNQNDKILEVL